MISLFRKIRHSLVPKNNTAKYIKYAIGEIILVVVGILIALGINTWNENRKDQQYLSLILKEIHKDIATDLDLIYGGIDPRIKYKAKGADSLLYLIYQKPANAEKLVIDNFIKSSTTFALTISYGGYESLKSKGIEILKNDSLRNKIVYFYENRVPRYLSFVHENDDILEQNIDRLTTKIFNLEPAKGEDGNIVLGYVPIHKDLLNDQNLYQVVKIFYQDLSSKRYRIRSLKRDYLELNDIIETYLRERNIAFTPFDPDNVNTNF